MGGNRSDPYTTCQIMGKPKTQFKSHYVPDNLNPVWNFEAELMGLEEGESLKFDVFDFDVPTKQDDFLGTATLEYKDFIKPDGFYGSLALTGDRAQGTLTVRVKVHPKFEEKKPEQQPQQTNQPDVIETKET